MVGRAGRPELGPRAAGRAGAAGPAAREDEPAQLLDRRAQQAGGLLGALDPGELPAALGARAGLDGPGAAQVVDARQDDPDGPLLGLGDPEGPERRDDAVELDLGALLVLVLLQRRDERVVLGHEVRQVELLAEDALGPGQQPVDRVEGRVAVEPAAYARLLQEEDLRAERLSESSG